MDSGLAPKRARPGMTMGILRERLLRLSRLSEAANLAGIHAGLRTDRGDHRRGIAARRATGVMVGHDARAGREDAAARGLHRRRLRRDTPGGRQERAVQADEITGTALSTSSPRRRGPIHAVFGSETR